MRTPRSLSKFRSNATGFVFSALSVLFFFCKFQDETNELMNVYLEYSMVERLFIFEVLDLDGSGSLLGAGGVRWLGPYRRTFGGRLASGALYL